MYLRSQVTPTPTHTTSQPVLTPTSLQAYYLPLLSASLWVSLISGQQNTITEPLSIWTSNPYFDPWFLSCIFAQPAQIRQTRIWDLELINEQIRVQNLFPKQASQSENLGWELGSLQQPSLVSMSLLFSWRERPGAGRILMYQFIIRLVASEISIQVLHKSNEEPSTSR